MMRILLIYKETLLPGIWFVRQKSLFMQKSLFILNLILSEGSFDGAVVFLLDEIFGFLAGKGFD